MSTQPEVIRVLDAFRARLLAQEAAQFQVMAERWLMVEGALESRIFELAMLASEQGNLTPGQLARWDRYVELLRQVRAEVARYVDVVAPEIEGRQLAILGESIGVSRQALESMGVNVAAGFNTVKASAVRDMVGVLADGSPLSRLLRESWLDGAAALSTVLIKNTALGINPRQTARDMRNAVGGSLDRMLRIARTEQLRVSREATRESYQKSGIVTGYRRLARKDRRTCAACLIEDGRLYGLDESFVEHVNGRCALVPVLDSMDVKWQRGKRWLLEQPADVQREILGPGRYDGWKAGKFRLEDIPTVHKDEVWGDSLQIRTLRELMQGIDRAA